MIDGSETGLTVNVRYDKKTKLPVQTQNFNSEKGNYQGYGIHVKKDGSRFEGEYEMNRMKSGILFETNGIKYAVEYDYEEDIKNGVTHHNQKPIKKTLVTE